jgi:hypothetical protein
MKKIRYITKELCFTDLFETFWRYLDPRGKAVDLKHLKNEEADGKIEIRYKKKIN